MFIRLKLKCRRGRKGKKYKIVRLSILTLSTFVKNAYVMVLTFKHGLFNYFHKEIDNDKQMNIFMIP
jgi:hypothetical protein